MVRISHHTESMGQLVWGYPLWRGWAGAEAESCPHAHRPPVPGQRGSGPPCFQARSRDCGQSMVGPFL